MSYYCRKFALLSNVVMTAVQGMWSPWYHKRHNVRVRKAAIRNEKHLSGDNAKLVICARMDFGLRHDNFRHSNEPDKHRPIALNLMPTNVSLYYTQARRQGGFEGVRSNPPFGLLYTPPYRLKLVHNSLAAINNHRHLNESGAM